MKYTVEDVSVSFRIAIYSNPELDISGQKSHILRRQLGGYKTVDLPTKQKKGHNVKAHVSHL